jgi:hypothetical protein
MVKKYGQTVLVTQDLALENYLDRCISFDVDCHTLAYFEFRILKQVNSRCHPTPYTLTKLYFRVATYRVGNATCTCDYIKRYQATT